jgi:hypothetical protein
MRSPLDSEGSRRAGAQGLVLARAAAEGLIHACAGASGAAPEVSVFAPRQGLSLLALLVQEYKY